MFTNILPVLRVKDRQTTKRNHAYMIKMQNTGTTTGIHTGRYKQIINQRKAKKEATKVKGTILNDYIKDRTMCIGQQLIEIRPKNAY